MEVQVYFNIMRLYLNALVGTQIKVEFSWMRNTNIDRRTGRDVPRFARLLLFVSTKQPRVMAFLHNNESNSWFIIRFQFNACLTNRCKFVLQNL